MNSKLQLHLKWIEDVVNDDDDDPEQMYSEQTMRSSNMMNLRRHRRRRNNIRNNRNVTGTTSNSSSINIHCMVLSRKNNLDRRSRRMNIHSQSLQGRRRILRWTERILFLTTTTSTTKMTTMMMMVVVSIILCTTTTAFPGSSSYVPNHFHHFRIHHHYYSKRRQFLVFQAIDNNDNGNDRIEDEIQQLLQGAATGTGGGGTGGKFGDNNTNANTDNPVNDDNNISTNKIPLQKVFVSDGDLDEATQLEIEEGQPSEMMIMKQLLGINGFTVLLGVLIVFFLSMNTILGVGWLGKFIGIPGTGTFEEMSPSLPALLDLNRPEFRL